MLRLRLTILFVLLTLLTVATAQNSTPDLSTLLQSFKSLKANFSQVVYDNHGKTIQKTYGQMALERPGKFRWEVTKPIPQLIIANAQKLWIYDKDLQQVTIRSLKQAAGDAPALMLSQDHAALDENYNIKETQKSKSNLRWFIFTPKANRQGMLASTEIGFMNNQIQEMRLKDNLDHMTSIQFSNVVTNHSFATSTFVFKTPKGVDIIDETHRQNKKK